MVPWLCLPIFHRPQLMTCLVPLYPTNHPTPKLYKANATLIISSITQCLKHIYVSIFKSYALLKTNIFTLPLVYVTNFSVFNPVSAQISNHLPQLLI